MSAALSILMGHRYANLGEGGLCVDLAGNRACKWKARRNGDRHDLQHMYHLADLIEQAYETDILAAGQLQGVRDIVTDSLDMDEALGHPGNEFGRGRRQVLHEMADALGPQEGVNP